VAKHVGRHRAPGFSPLTELTQIAGDSAKPAVRATAVMAVSTGMLAGMVVPAQAATIVAGVDGVSSDGQALDTPVSDLLGISGLPSTDGPGLAPAAPAPVAATGLVEAVEAAVGPVVTAPDTVAGLPTFGALGFKTKTITVPAVTQVSRSTAPRTSPAPAAKAATPAPAPAPVSGGSVLSVAASLLGIPYRYGGSSPSTGFDCSGFTSYVYRIARGITIPRTAEGQRKGSARVTSPVPGDLVFFGVPATHVGIYAGNGMMYDSPHTGTVSQLRKIYSGNVSYGRF